MPTPVDDILASEKAWQRRAERAEAEIERLRAQIAKLEADAAELELRRNARFSR